MHGQQNIKMSPVFLELFSPSLHEAKTEHIFPKNVTVTMCMIQFRSVAFIRTCSF